MNGREVDQREKAVTAADWHVGSVCYARALLRLFSCGAAIER